MSLIERLSETESYLRPLAFNFPAGLVTRLYSSGKRKFLSEFVDDTPVREYFKEISKPKTLWDIEFNLPLFNAAGMFKYGYGYETCAIQGAGAFLAGTTTSKPRQGNIKNGIKHPFLPFPKSGLAVNWMGLPNEGHATVAKRLSKEVRIGKCPIGASLSKDPGASGKEALEDLVEGIKLYDKAKVDFIEINESCPNVPHEVAEKNDKNLDQSLINRLEYISKNFIEKKDRNIPLIVKFSCDTDINQVKDLTELLIDLKFDGVNLGNTSTKYKEIATEVNSKELNHFQYFTETFGGGVSGKYLKDLSFDLAAKAVEVANQKDSHEFHVIRTGGISSPFDLDRSEEAGISLNQWYTGYFKVFAEYGHAVYKEFFRNIEIED